MSLNPARSTRVFAGRLRPRFGLGPFLGLGLVAFLGSQVLTSCGSDDDKSCEPDSEKACFSSDCPDNEGTQVCNADGSAYSACSCDGSGTAGSGGAAGSGGGNNGGSSGAAGAGGGTGAEFRGAVGLPCQTAADCSGGLDCIPSSATGPFQDGGPEDGYCTTTCTDAGGECEAIDDIAACAIGAQGTQQYCAALCQTGFPTSGSELKCSLIQGQRDTLGCLNVTNPPTTGRDLGLCIPVCHSDEGCGGGRFCNLGTGVCVDEQPQGLAMGEACTDDAECSGGQCLTFTNGGGFCSGLCTFGLIGGCGYDEDVPAGERGAACLTPALSSGDVGDVGYCGQLCDVAEDCAQEGYTCELLVDLFGADPDPTVAFGRTGFCNPPDPAAADAGTP
jgi:Dickkopf-like protein